MTRRQNKHHLGVSFRLLTTASANAYIRYSFLIKEPQLSLHNHIVLLDSFAFFLQYTELIKTFSW